MRKLLRTSEKGTSMAEFAIISVVFFMMIFGIIEFGRLFYTHNALTDAARRGARYAVVNKEADAECVKNIVVYGETHVNASTCAPTGQPLIYELNDDLTPIKSYYLGDEEAVKKAMQAVANQGKAK